MSVEANLRGVACPAGSAPWQGLPAAGRPPGLMEPAPGGRAARASLEASVTDLLGGLGATSDRVAESLRRAGVRGTPGRPASAPMAVFLAAVVGADPAVRAVTATADEVRIERHARWRSTVTVRFPPPVAAFARAFDVGFYAGLRG